MPFIGLIFALVVVGGLATLVAIGDPHNARLAPSLYWIHRTLCGLGAASLSIILALLGAKLFESETLTGLGFFGGDMAGGLGGAVFGFYRAVLRRRRIESEVHEVEALD